MTDSLPPELDDVLHDLGRCIEALGPYTETAVLTGGLAAVLYRWCLPVVSVAQPPLTTFDMDWGLPSRLGQSHGDGLHSRMLQGGFHALLSGAGDQPITYYQHERHGTTRLSPIHVEFIAPREGSGPGQAGQDRGIIEVERDLHAQTDPYVGLLLVENIKEDVSSISSLRLSTTHRIRLPHPACFIMQKILIRPRREPHKRDNDAAHIFDVAVLTRRMWPEMAATLAQLENAGRFPKPWFSRHVGRYARCSRARTLQGLSVLPASTAVRWGNRAAPTENAVYRVVSRFLEAAGLSNQ